MNDIVNEHPQPMIPIKYEWEEQSTKEAQWQQKFTWTL